VHVTCPHCEAAYDVELPASALQSGRKRLKFRCGVCGQRFLIERPDAASEPEPAESSVRAQTPKPPAAPSMRLRQDGSVYELADMATLQRWIVERRVNPHDEVSVDGADFESIRSRPDLKVFFQLVSQIEQAELRSSPEREEDLPREDTEEAPWREPRSGGQVSFDSGPADDVFAALRGDEEPESGVEESSDSSDDWDPVDPPSPRLRTDHGFNPSAFGARHAAVEEEATQGHEVPGVSDDFEIDPEPKTIALAEPLSSMDETADLDPFFGGPTDVDGMTEEAPFRAEELGSESPFMSSMDTVETEMDPGLIDEAMEDAVFRAPLEDDGPDLPSIESLHEPAENEFISVDEGSSDTLFSVTEDDFMEDDDYWMESQASDAKTRKLILGALAGLGVVFLLFQFLGGEEDETGASQVAVTDATSTVSESVAESASGSADSKAAAESVGSDDAAVEKEPVTEDDASEKASTSSESSRASSSSSSSSKSSSSSASSSSSTSSSSSASSSSSGGSRSAERLVNLGWEAQGRGDNTSAAGHFQQALSKSPRDSEAHFGLGYAQEQLGKKDTAVNHYCQALKYGPSTDTRREAEGRLRVLSASCD
jgi:predicted Zn finger-like uncharacterized protein